ncbi:MAG: ferredoxin [Actinobacteria bacterium]|nr:ferredoxin [Actinomycetota bacterium]
MKVTVDYDLCESNAICVGIDPETFEIRDDDVMYIIDEHPDASRRAKIEEAVRRCPKQALAIIEE